MAFSANRKGQMPDSPSTQHLLGQSGPGGPNSSSTSVPDTGRYGSKLAPSISDKYSLSADPASWGSELSPSHREPDDFLHNPDPRRDTKNDAGGTIFTARGLANLGCILILGLGILTLFAGYPLVTYFTQPKLSNQGGFNLGGINASGQVPEIPGNFGLIDRDTPENAKTKQSYETGEDLVLVFSDEFNVDGRTFYPGQDPYWEAVDLHYWGTNNLEWYDPKAVTTEGGALKITLSDEPSHGLSYTGGMMSTWNKFCFTGGLIESSVILPGNNNIAGLWPAIWTMGNLGRAGFGGSLEGMWPYTYDACDVGTLANQTLNGLPRTALTSGDPAPEYGGTLSYLPGQRLSRCTCPGESHPGPVHADGTFVGRAAPEIDIFEAQVSETTGGHVSQSCQWAPFNFAYEWHNNSDTLTILDDHTELNEYKGGVFQQATSGVAITNQECYEFETACYAIYGFEYKQGFDDGYIIWINDGKPAWKMTSDGTDADTRVEISARPIPQEPMYILANLGMSENFGFVNYAELIFPTTMSVDWIRVYQSKDAINVGCDPVDFPTRAYIEEYIETYTNPNLTTWVDDFGVPFPKNSFLGEC